MLIEGEDIGGEFYDVCYGVIPRPQEDILIRMHNEEIHDHATAVALAELDDRERRIFETRFLDAGTLKVKLKDLAAEFKVSIPMIHKIAERAREKVRASYNRTIESMPQGDWSSNDDEGLKKAA
jgi:DNA-directed RNA polymerase sigma subunit (sigma70/sigma32)